MVENFASPKDYEATIDYIKCLIDKRKFVFLEGTCNLGDHFKEGSWVDDIIYHKIACPNCHQKFICILNTYRGRGSFGKGE
ncbi:hypothetical protein ACILDU_02300 [Capnocytophaga canimorsus]|uniref:hypothetical protein n=1 Tax=Capnocytophaga canimorsus TaxID=28188 RepID=UPI0037D84070